MRVPIVADLREGHTNGFPACCTLRYALTALIPQQEQALHRGLRFTPAGIEYVPCLVRHKATLTHAERERLLERDWLLERDEW